jgi:hypothetical protein
MTDLELISLSLKAQFRGVDSENDLFRNLPAAFLAKIERNVYNRQKRNLVPDLEIIRLKLASFLMILKIILSSTARL